MPRRSTGSALVAFWTTRRLAFPVFLIVAAFLIATGRSAGLTDPDWWWHLETGRLIWETRGLPAGDPFSWTRAGADWVLHEWLFQVGLYRLWRAAGDGGVAVAVAGLLALAWYLPFATADRMVRRPLVCLALAIGFGVGLAMAGAPRPHMISLVFFAVLLWAVFEAKYAGRHRVLLVVPPMMVIWVNMHGGFALGVAAMAALALLEWLVLAGRHRDGRQLGLCLWLTGTAVATLAAAAINPDGIAHLAYPLYVSGLGATAAIGEWRSIMTTPAQGIWYAAGGLVFFLLQMAAPRRADATEVLFPAALFIAGLVQARHAPFAGQAMMVFAAPALWRERAPPALPGRLDGAVGWAVALVALAVPFALARSDYPALAERAMPGDAAAHIERAGLTGRMFNDYDIGGYLIHRLGPERKVFIDGRADLYGDAFYTAYALTVGGHVPLARFFDGWAIGHAVLRPDQALTQMLLLDGWRVDFRGRRHLVLVPGARGGGPSPQAPGGDPG